LRTKHLNGSQSAEHGNILRIPLEMKCGVQIHHNKSFVARPVFFKWLVRHRWGPAFCSLRSLISPLFFHLVTVTRETSPTEHYLMRPRISITVLLRKAFIVDSPHNKHKFGGK